MLKKINRITSKKEFESVKRNGIIKQYLYFGLISLNLPVSHRLTTLFDKEGGERKDIKFGFIISKKISKKAVVRNKIKRLIAQEVQNNLDKFEDGFRGIFLIKKNIIDEKDNIKNIKFL
jgi:ribonuclease P protein component